MFPLPWACAIQICWATSDQPVLLMGMETNWELVPNCHTEACLMAAFPHQSYLFGLTAIFEFLLFNWFMKMCVSTPLWDAFSFPDSHTQDKHVTLRPERVSATEMQSTSRGLAADGCLKSTGFRADGSLQRKYWKRALSFSLCFNKQSI